MNKGVLVSYLISEYIYNLKFRLSTSIIGQADSQYFIWNQGKNENVMMKRITRYG